MKDKLRIELKCLRNIIDGAVNNDCLLIKEISNRLFELLKIVKCSAIAGFYPKQEEINILPILLDVIAQGYKVALPRVHKKDEPLLFIRWAKEDKLEMNKLGFLEPSLTGEAVIPDLIITPLLGFDRKLHRLGYGKGYYDRTFPKYPNAIRVGVAYAIQEVENIPIEPHDQKLDYIITENEIIRNDP